MLPQIRKTGGYIPINGGDLVLWFYNFQRHPDTNYSPVYDYVEDDDKMEGARFTPPMSKE